MTLRRRVAACWGAALVVPGFLAATTGLGRCTIAAAAAWALGLPIAAIALARDPGGRGLAALRGSGATVRIAVLAVLLLSFGAIVLPRPVVLCAASMGALAFLSLWAIRGAATAPARWLIRFVTAASAIASIVLAAEIVLRTPMLTARTGGHRPGIVRFEREQYDHLWERNPLELRSLHLDGPAEPGRRQILALGDEATFGALVARTQDTWPCRLEETLAGRGRAVEVVNAGRRGFTTANEAEWLERYGGRFAPDLVIVQFAMNDTVPSYPGLRAERSFWYYHLTPLLPIVHPYLETRSYVYSALDALKEHQGMRWLHPEGYLPLYEDAFPGWKQAREGLHEIAEWARSRGASTLLVIFPDLEGDTVLAEGRYKYASVHEKVAATAASEGMEVLDLLPAFTATGRPPEAWWPLPCEALPGIEAQQLAATAIAGRIESSGLLSEPVGTPVRDTPRSSAPTPRS